MADYFNIKKMIDSKREYKQQMARVDALPPDYQFVFKKIAHYMFQFARGDGYDMLKIHYELIDLFEEGVQQGKPVLDVTGKDVAAFSDELLRSANTYIEAWHDKLNREIAEKLGNGGA